MAGKVSALVDKFSREPEHKENEVTRKARDVINQQPNKASDLISRFNQLGVNAPSTTRRQTPQNRSVSANVTNSLSAASPPKPTAARSATPPAAVAEPKQHSPTASPAAAANAAQERNATDDCEAPPSNNTDSWKASRRSSTTPEDAIPIDPTSATAGSPPPAPHIHPSDKECSDGDDEEEEEVDSTLAAYAEDEITNDPLSYYENITTSPSRQTSPVAAVQSVPAADREVDAVPCNAEPHHPSLGVALAAPETDGPNRSDQDELAAAATMLDAMRAELVLPEETNP